MEVDVCIVNCSMRQRCSVLFSVSGGKHDEVVDFLKMIGDQGSDVLKFDVHIGDYLECVEKLGAMEHVKVVKLPYLIEGLFVHGTISAVDENISSVEALTLASERVPFWDRLMPHQQECLVYVCVLF